MQTAVITDTVAIPRAVLSSIGFMWTTEFTSAEKLAFVEHNLSPYWGTFTGRRATANRTPTSANQQEGATRRNQQAGKETITPRSAKGTRARKGSRRDQIVAELQAAPLGLSRGALLEKFGLKGDKAGEMSISNALTALTKGNELRREGGKYLCVIPGARTTATQNVREPVAA